MSSCSTGVPPVKIATRAGGVPVVNAPSGTPSLGIGLPVGASSPSAARDDEHSQQHNYDKTQQDTGGTPVERMGKMPMPQQDMGKTAMLQMIPLAVVGGAMVAQDLCVLDMI